MKQWNFVSRMYVSSPIAEASLVDSGRGQLLFCPNVGYVPQKSSISQGTSQFWDQKPDDESTNIFLCVGELLAEGGWPLTVQKINCLELRGNRGYWPLLKSRLLAEGKIWHPSFWQNKNNPGFKSSARDWFTLTIGTKTGKG